MSRDPYKLHAFNRAHALVLDVYRSTKTFPPDERFGLQMQVRRAAASVPTNLVEGSAKRSVREYLRFVEIAVASASEARYLITLATQLHFVTTIDGARLTDGYGHVIRALQSLIARLHPTPEA